MCKQMTHIIGTVNIICLFPSSMSIHFPPNFWANSGPAPQSLASNSNQRPVCPLLLCRKLGSFQLELAFYTPLSNSPSLVWTCYLAPSKPPLKAEFSPPTLLPGAPQLPRLTLISHKRPQPHSSSPDKLSPKLLRSLLLELFNDVINLLLTFGIILIKTVLCMYY